MTDQQEIQGAQPMELKVPQQEAVALLIQMGKNLAISAAIKSLEDLQKQHPGVSGLTLALAVIGRQAAEEQMFVSRKAITLAAKYRLPIEGHSLNLDFRKDGVWVIASSDGSGIN